MKFEMTANEFQGFCAHLAETAAAGQLASQLENELTNLRSELCAVKEDLEGAKGDRDYMRRRLEQSNQENDTLRYARDEVLREIRDLRAEAVKLRDQLSPFRKERQLSEIFHLHITGQKIAAIKGVRELYHPLGLKEAKECVEGVAPKKESVRDEIHTELSELALIFRDWKTASPDVLRERLRPFVSVGSSVNIASILNGNFRAEDVTPPAPQIDTTTAAGVGSEAGDGMQE